MLDLLINIDINLLTVSIATAITLCVISVLVCFILCMRRIARNSIKNNRLKEQFNFETTLNTALTSNGSPIDRTSFKLDNKSIFNEVLLRYFRMLNGKQAETLRDIVEKLNFEPQLRNTTKIGTIGRRMEAMQILSYLETQASLVSIYEGLSSSKKYIRLTAARCLTRREADVFLDDIILSINSAFPDDPQILADILFRFGRAIIPQLETYIELSPNDSIKAACLEAMVLAMPPVTSLDLSQLMDSPDERVRAATVSLSAVTSHKSKDDILFIALSDSATKVKIRAAKIAYKSKRTDTVSLLFKLSQDPLLWVRYWSIKAIWNSGRQGRKLVETMSRNEDATSRMARQVSLECQTAYPELA